MANATPDTRQQILKAALKRFAAQGYAGTSVQEIVDAARVTKPTLYYHFRNKAGLYRALMDWAFEERYRLLQEAVARGGSLAQQLTEICAASFKFIQKNRELMRLAFAATFAAQGEVPSEAQCCKRGLRNFEFIHGLIKQAVARGELTRQFDPEELALGFSGSVNFYVMAYLVGARASLSARNAERIVELFLAGAKPFNSTRPSPPAS
jgi:TetR/AcrR family transcriptional regulator